MCEMTNKTYQKHQSKLLEYFGGISFTSAPKRLPVSWLVVLATLERRQSRQITGTEIVRNSRQCLENAGHLSSETPLGHRQRRFRLP